MLTAAMLQPYIDHPTDVVVGYHQGCNDGFGAALVLWYLLGPEATYKPLRYDDQFSLDPYRGKLVILVDFSFSRDRILAVKDAAQQLLVVDHHKTAEENLRGLDFCHFDMSHSGAYLTFDLFKSLLSSKTPFSKLQLLISYIEDRDLWSWALPNSRAVSAALSMWPHSDLEIWDRNLRAYSAKDTEALYDMLVQEGNILLKRDEMLVRSLAKAAVPRTFEGLTAIEVNSNVFWSELGEYLGGQAQVVMVWGVQANGKIRYELRTRDSSVDVGVLAKRYGGGGHKNAAGFSSDQRV